MEQRRRGIAKQRVQAGMTQRERQARRRVHSDRLPPRRLLDRVAPRQPDNGRQEQERDRGVGQRERHRVGPGDGFISIEEVEINLGDEHQRQRGPAQDEHDPAPVLKQ